MTGLFWYQFHDNDGGFSDGCCWKWIYDGKDFFWLSGGGSALKSDYSLQFQDHGDLGRSSRAVRKVKRSWRCWSTKTKWNIKIKLIHCFWTYIWTCIHLQTRLKTWMMKYSKYSKGLILVFQVKRGRTCPDQDESERRKPLVQNWELKKTSGNRLSRIVKMLRQKFTAVQ